jgi:hypothetical protein
MHPQRADNSATARNLMALLATKGVGQPTDFPKRLQTYPVPQHLHQSEGNPKPTDEPLNKLGRPGHCISKNHWIRMKWHWRVDGAEPKSEAIARPHDIIFIIVINIIKKYNFCLIFSVQKPIR